MKRSKNLALIFFLVMAWVQLNCFAQPAAREVNNQQQSWFSINSTTRISNKLGIIADLHTRRTQFLDRPSFNFVRAGINYWVNENLTVAVGYGQMWVAPSKPLWSYYAKEHRIYQQVQLSTKVGKVTLLQRLRNEQRWQQKIVNDKFIHQYKFTNRVRYLLSATVPVFKNPKYPMLVVADELMVQVGKEILYNTFDQNRAFVGIKQTITKALSFDLGYMLVYQQKSSGYQYDRNNTFRWFFYYMPDARQHKKK